ncbi:Na/Pi cotransporter family protein [Roseomonas elaeocarpi]|uniref:Na/Pi cotransporter family protein n=1 Tax=Roseomonas elaeocarpi TaxID=907779 RepID=A0ABV6K178_9PROT
MNWLSVLIQVAGEAAMLLFGLSLVQRGVERAYGARLREVLGRALRDRWRAAAAGLVATTALQSSTATALMLGGLNSNGSLALVPAMAAMLGANVGTAVIAQALSFDLRPVFPLLILLGWTAFRRGRRARTRDLGRAVIGLGVMLCALYLLVGSMGPVEHAPALREILHLLDGAPALAVILAAALAWGTHSSLAAVLLVGSLAASGAAGPEVALAMVAGANLGGALPPLLAARHAGKGLVDPARLRLPVGNLINRLIGTGIVLAALPQLAGLLSAHPGRLVADAHLGFNLVMAVLTLPVLNPVAALLRRLLPGLPPEADPGAPRYLDDASLNVPAVALANATREVLRVVDTLDTMLRDTAAALREADRDAARAVGRRDDVVDRLHAAVHAYLARLPRDGVGEAEAQRLAEIRLFLISLEHAGDAVSRGLAKYAARRARRGIALSPAALSQLDALTERLRGQLRLAVAVFMSDDGQAARQLVLEKESWREAEREAAEALGEAGGMASGADGAAGAGLMLDVTRDLKRVAAHVAAVAYPLLERQGALRTSRLRPVAAHGEKPGEQPVPAGR